MFKSLNALQRCCLMGRRMVSSLFDGRIPVDAVITRVSVEQERNLPLVEVTVPLKDATWLSEDMKQKIYEKYPFRINKDGQLVVESSKTYSVTLNKADCFDKIRTALLDLNDTTRSLDIELSDRDKANNAARLRLIEYNKKILKPSAK